MPLPIYLYTLLSVFIAGSAAFNVNWEAGFYAIATSLLFIVVAGGLKSSLWWGDRTQKIGAPVVALVPLALAQWLAGGFSVQLYGYHLTGAQWGWIGFAICFVFANKNFSGPPTAP